MPFNRDSNSYILIFVAIMVGVVSISLAFISSSLKPTIKANVVLDQKIQILSSVVFDEEFNKEFVDNEYATKIEELLIDKDGNLVESDSAKTAFNVALNFNKEIRKPEEERAYPVFKYNGDGESYYIFPLEGQGLWDRIWGYVAVKEDFNTIYGSSFDHKGETPGLGALITEDWFKKQFREKKIFDTEGAYALQVLKGQGNEKAKTDPYSVDGLSGATVTAQGVDAMLNKGFEMYKPFFEKTSENNQ